MHYYQFNIADFALHTSHLTLEEEGIYRRLLDYYYDTEGPIPKETRQVIRRLRLVEYSDTVALILDEFFVLFDDGWHNLRADIEINDYKKKAKIAKENGKKGGRPKKNKGIKTQPVILDNQQETGSKANQELRTINQEPLTNDPPHNPPKGQKVEWEDDYIQLFWSAYPKKEDKKKAFARLSKMIRKKPDKDFMQMIIDRVNQKALVTDRKYWPSPDRYLRDEKWNDEIVDYESGENYDKPNRPSFKQTKSFAEKQRRQATKLMEEYSRPGDCEASGVVIYEDGGSIQ